MRFGSLSYSAHMPTVSFAGWFNPTPGTEGSKESKLLFRILIEAWLRFMALASIRIAGCAEVHGPLYASFAYNTAMSCSRVHL